MISRLRRRLSLTCDGLTRDAIIEGKLPSPLRRVGVRLTGGGWGRGGLLAAPKVSQPLKGAGGGGQKKKKRHAPRGKNSAYPRARCSRAGARAPATVV